MKKKLFTILPILLTATATLPICMSMSSCVSNSNKIGLYKSITIDQATKGKNIVTEGKDINFNYEDLFYSHEECVIFLGSTKWDSTNQFFTDNVASRQIYGDSGSWEKSYENGTFYKAITEPNKDIADNEKFESINKKIPFYFLIDTYGPDQYTDFNDGNLVQPKPKDIIGPFDTWQDQKIIDNEQNKKYWLNPNKAPETTDYIRNDQSAKNFRQFCKIGSMLYESYTQFNYAANSSTSYVIFIEKNKGITEIKEINSSYSGNNFVSDLVTHYATKTE